MSFSNNSLDLINANDQVNANAKAKQASSDEMNWTIIDIEGAPVIVTCSGAVALGKPMLIEMECDKWVSYTFLQEKFLPQVHRHFIISYQILLISHILWCL